MLNLYAGLVADFSLYSIDIGFSLFEWTWNYKKTKSVFLLACGPFSISVFNNKELFKKLRDQIEEREKDDASSSS